MIVLEHLTKKFDKFTSVDNLSLHIHKGEFFGLLGPNGAGKTTTIRMLMTLARPTSGRIIIDGQDMTRNAPALKAEIGLVPQHINLDNELTPRENLDLHGRLFGIPTKERRERIEELLHFVELEGRADEIVRKFSGGMKRRVLIARALMHRPHILLLDEPTIGLDPMTRRKIWELVRKLNTNGQTVLLTTHYLEEAEALCNRVGLMNKGRLVELGTPEELKIRTGPFVVEIDKGGERRGHFFPTREAGLAFMQQLHHEGHTDPVSLRATHLEDVFIHITEAPPSAIGSLQATREEKQKS
ncbi:ABC transporter ATP-binding protein [Heliophilum fasciatum]|uniref:ABC-2 type transport system ATP-binding protein n=1 Tax=Heliophilum fasciatum TaxID=35700 RepID=A0A4R2RZ78_9FIRM|nr:ATP-binding cassette domain-containing protein [Heliophilum fasciatum]MCW2277188.1 ABC-2 type transport system ATP-binding protein [Heliophilum fasciatum]TCP68177.1 ABC-2 type transport system ATP-binding protein [Heliophilum fasciatum]